MTAMRLILALLACLTATVATAALAVAHAQETRPLDVGGMPRDYLVYRPAGMAPGAALPALVVLHAAAATKEVTFERLHLKPAADAAGVLIVVPEASLRDPRQPPDLRRNPRMWNDGSGRGRQSMIGVDDVGYLDAVLDDVVAKGGVDRTKLMVTGYSMGGSMALRYAGERPDRVAAVGSVAGHLWSEPKGRLPPLLLIAGASDPLAPLDGAEGKRPMREEPARWATAAGCTDVSTESKPADGLTRFDWTGCPAGITVRLLIVAGLGHQWPGGEASKQPQLGPYSSAVDATAAFIDFLRQHGRPPA